MRSEVLRALLEVKKQGSITTAAKVIGKSPSQLRVWLSDLEDDLGVVLINSDGYRAKLTTDGDVIARHAMDVLRELDSIDSKFDYEGHSSPEKLTIGLLDALPVAPFKEVLWQLQQYNPQLSIAVKQLQTPEILNGIETGTIDFGMIFFHGNSYPGISEHVAGYAEIVTVVAADHPLAQSPTKVNTGDRAAYLQLLPKSYLGFGIDKVSKYSENYWLLDNFELLISLLENGVGWAELPRHWVEPLIRIGRLVELKPKSATALWWPVQLVWHSNSPSNNCSRWFIERMTSPKPGLSIAGIPINH